MDTYDLMECIGSCVEELDRTLGWRLSGPTITGRRIPTYKDFPAGGLGPQWYTERNLVMPVLSLAGYADTRDRPGWGPETWPIGEAVIATTSMNRPMEGTEEAVRAGMAEYGLRKGIATDGFRWTVMSGSGAGIAVSRHDLRPYYIEILDRRRFRAAVPADRRAAELFLLRLDRDRRS